MPFGEDGEGAQQAIQVLVRVEGGDRQQERLGASLGGEIEESWIDAGEQGANSAGREAVPAAQVVRGGAGDGYDAARDGDAPEEKEIPGRQIERSRRRDAR